MRNASSDFASLKSPAGMILRSTSRWKSMGFAPPCAIHKIVAKSESMRKIIGKVATYNNNNTVVCNQNMNKRTSFDSEIRLSCGPGYIVSLTGGLRWWIPNQRLGIVVFHLVHIIHQSLVLVTLNGELLNYRRRKTRRRTIPRQNAQRRCGRRVLRARLGRRIRALVPPRVNQILNVCNCVLVILCENPAVSDWRCCTPRLQNAIAHCASELCKPWCLNFNSNK